MSRLVEQILDDDSISFNKAVELIENKTPYFMNMYKDIERTIDNNDIKHIISMMNKYGYRNWFVDFFTKTFIQNHEDEFNDIVKFHCDYVNRDLSMFKYPIRCVEFSIIMDTLVKRLLMLYYEPKPKREPRPENKLFDPNTVT